MAKSDNLTDFLRGLADKFRSVLGTSSPINPQDFEDKIQGVYDKGFSEGGPTGITATAADVLSGKVFGSGGSAKATGTMPNASGSTLTTTTRSLSGGYLIYQPPGVGYVDTSTKLRCAQANVASTVGLTAAKIAKGQTVLGIAGSYTGYTSGVGAVAWIGGFNGGARKAGGTGIAFDTTNLSVSGGSETSHNQTVTITIKQSGTYRIQSKMGPGRMTGTVTVNGSSVGTSYNADRTMSAGQKVEISSEFANSGDYNCCTLLVMVTRLA